MESLAKINQINKSIYFYLNNNYLKKVVEKHIYNNSKINSKYINMIVVYIKTQKEHLSKIDLLLHTKQKIFI